MFTCSKILWYLRVAWSIKSRTVHPALQGTTTAVSPKVTVTFIVTVTVCSSLSRQSEISENYSRSHGAAPRAKRRHLPVDNWTTGVSGQKIRAKPPVRRHWAKPELETVENILNCTKMENKRVFTAAECGFVSCWAVGWYTQTKQTERRTRKKITAAVKVQEIPSALHPNVPV